jgi:hypothetical protein
MARLYESARTEGLRAVAFGAWRRSPTTSRPCARRFSALQTPFAFFDGPGGTQVPDSVIDAITTYLRESNANVGGPYGTSIRTEALIDQAHLTAGRFLNCDPAGVGFGPNMSTLNFALTRAAARELRRGDEIVVTRLDHDANVSPWLEAAHDLGLVIRFADIRDDTTVDLDDLARLLGPRTKVVAFPVAANSVGTLTDVRRIVELAHDAGGARLGRRRALRAARPDETSRAGASTCSSARRTSSSARTGNGVRAARAARALAARTRCGRPRATRGAGVLETGTLQHELLAGFEAGGRVHGRGRLGRDPRHERALASASSTDCRMRTRCTGCRPWTAAWRPSPSRTPSARRARSRQRSATAGSASGGGDYYAIEVMKRLELPDGAVRAGIVHYNTEARSTGCWRRYQTSDPRRDEVPRPRRRRVRARAGTT